MRPVIFLDFDGVLRPLPPRGRLCTPKQLARRFDDLRLLRVDPGMCTLYSGIDAQAMSLLAQLCSAFDAQIVLTSSWSAVYPLAAFQPLFRPWHLTQRVIGSVPAGALSRSAPGCKRILVPAGYPWMICPWKSISPSTPSRQQACLMRMHMPGHALSFSGSAKLTTLSGICHAVRCLLICPSAIIKTKTKGGRSDVEDIVRASQRDLHHRARHP